MQALLTANISSQWTPVALIGAGLFGTLLALPLLCNPDKRPGRRRHQLPQPTLTGAVGEKP